MHSHLSTIRIKIQFKFNFCFCLYFRKPLGINVERFLGRCIPRLWIFPLGSCICTVCRYLLGSYHSTGGYIFPGFYFLHICWYSWNRIQKFLNGLSFDLLKCLILILFGWGFRSSILSFFGILFCCFFFCFLVLFRIGTFFCCFFFSGLLIDSCWLPCWCLCWGRLIYFGSLEWYWIDGIFFFGVLFVFVGVLLGGYWSLFLRVLCLRVLCLNGIDHFHAWKLQNLIACKKYTWLLRISRICFFLILGLWILLSCRSLICIEGFLIRSRYFLLIRIIVLVFQNLLFFKILFINYHKDLLLS